MKEKVKYNSEIKKKCCKIWGAEGFPWTTDSSVLDPLDSAENSNEFSSKVVRIFFSSASC
jgi:hypothetical protein